MNCVIDNSILFHLRQGRKMEVIRRYIKMKYRINMDMATLKKRVKHINATQLELTSHALVGN
ncbi:hypothetical protein LVD15_07110 [Fulvivirga maritima]|uniref:hypothetical protein n=1 Tax=Fulvivirga maritima TaxID=2904247 RepID=UPI001F1B67C2|nr:hypothetical protein [Fulvivirga maritima]UII28186.1 hypothetical protein LVD15_07110 [Fulvivirga maritima]